VSNFGTKEICIRIGSGHLFQATLYIKKMSSIIILLKKDYVGAMYLCTGNPEGFENIADVLSTLPHAVEVALGAPSPL
jgi:hypothetical protein